MVLNLRNPRTQKWLLLTILAFGMVYGYYNFMYVPKTEKARRLTHDLRKERELLEKGKRIAANFQTVQDDYQRLNASWEIAHALLPTQKEMEALLKNITLEGQKRDVNFLLFRPQDAVEKPYYWEHSIQVRTLSGYHDLAEFMSAIAAMDRIVNVNSLRLTSYRPNKGSSPNTVQADFVATIYIFKELGAPVTVEEPKDQDRRPIVMAKKKKEKA